MCGSDNLTAVPSRKAESTSGGSNNLRPLTSLVRLQTVTLCVPLRYIRVRIKLITNLNHIKQHSFILIVLVNTSVLFISYYKIIMDVF